MTATMARSRVISPPRAAASAYRGTVRHRRFGRARRTFEPRLFMAYLDVDALPGSLDAVPMWSARHVAPLRFRRRDFFDGGDQPLGPAVRDLVEARLGHRPTGPIFLLAHLRTFGHVFNPLAVYYCWNSDAADLDAIVLEVTNTPWGERHWYVIDARGDATSTHTPKAMHVSPFLAMDVEYHVSWTVPDADLSLRIEVERAGDVMFEAHLVLTHAALDRRRAIELPLRYPLMPLLGLVAIYREAMRLLIRRVPVHAHPDRGTRGTGR
jgi:uncharacterized protein